MTLATSGSPPLPADPTANLVMLAECVKLLTGVAPKAMLNPRRGSNPVARSRHLVMYLAHVTLSMPQAEIAARFRRDRTTVRYALRAVEDMREDAAVDAFLSEHEQGTTRLRRRP